MEGRWSSLAAVSILVVSAFAGYMLISTDQTRAYTVHDPILITGDAEFTPENGVTGGTGTPGDPFVIGGHEINAAGGNGIEIIGTSSYFVVRESMIYGATYAIYLNQVTNGRVESSDISDCEGGILVYMSTNVVASDNVISALYGAIGLGYCSDCLVEWNYCTLTDEGGSIETYECARVVIRENSIMGDRGYGIYIYSSTGVVAESNTVNGSGCIVRDSYGCSLWSNSFLMSGVVIGGSEVSDFVSHDIPTNNTANHRPIYYLRNLTGGIFSEPGVGQVIVANCSGLTLENLVIEDMVHSWEPWWFSGGLECYYVKDLTISGLTARNCGNSILAFRALNLVIRDCDFNDSWTAVYASESEYVTVDSCSISCSDEVRGGGVSLSDSNYTSILNTNMINCGSGVGVSNGRVTLIENCTMTVAGQSAVSTWASDGITSGLIVRNCTISGSTWAGLDVAGTDNVLVENSTITECGRGIESYSSTNITVRNNSIVANTESGVFLRSTVNILISGNELLGNDVSGIDISECLNTTITMNAMRGNNYGAYCEHSSDTLVYHNDFVGNIRNAYPYGGTGNAWDNGYPSGGNYWSDYEGVDNYSGPAQDVLGADGIGDTPYQIPSFAGYVDNYPLMAPVVGPVNEIPSAYFTIDPSQGNINTNFTLDASASQDAEDPSSELSVRWDIGYDGTFDIDWSTQKVAHWKFSTPGNHLVRMQVRDTGWLMNDTVVGVNIVDEAPIAAFTVTPASGVSTTVFTFDATTSQDLENGSAGLEVRWDWEDDGIWDDTWTSTKVFTHVFLVPGTYNVTLEVRDGAGLTNSTTKQVTVTLDVVAPVADAGEDQTVDVGELVTFDGSGSTDNIGIVNYTWSVVIDGSATYMYGASPSRTFTAGGEYEVTLVVMDAMGHTGTDTVLITVRDGKGSILADYWWLGVLAAVIITAFAAILLMRRRILI